MPAQPTTRRLPDCCNSRSPIDLASLTKFLVDRPRPFVVSHNRDRTIWYGTSSKKGGGHRTFQEPSCNRSVYLLCNSMGNYVLQNALERSTDFSLDARLSRLFERVFLCAADVAADVFQPRNPSTAFRKWPGLSPHITTAKTSRCPYPTTPKPTPTDWDGTAPNGQLAFPTASSKSIAAASSLGWSSTVTTTTAQLMTTYAIASTACQRTPGTACTNRYATTGRTFGDLSVSRFARSRRPPLLGPHSLRFRPPPQSTRKAPDVFILAHVPGGLECTNCSKHSPTSSTD